MMESGRISDNFNDLSGNIRSYIDLRVDYLKLLLTEKIAKLASFFLIAVIFFILSMFLLLFLSLAFIFWFGEEIGPTWLGALIITALYILTGFMVFVQRHRLFINPLVTRLTKILLEDHNENE